MPALSVTWTAPLQLRYAAWGAIQVLYAFAYNHCDMHSAFALLTYLQIYVLCMYVYVLW